MRGPVAFFQPLLSSLTLCLGCSFLSSFPCSCPFINLSLVATVHLCFFLLSFSFVSPCMDECHWRHSLEAVRGAQSWETPVRACAVDLLLDGLGFITWADRPALFVRLHFHLSTFSCANLAGGSLLLLRCCPLESTQSVFLGVGAYSNLKLVIALGVFYR